MVLLYRVLYIAMYPAIIIGYMEMSSRTNRAGTNENDQIVRPVKNRTREQLLLIFESIVVWNLLFLLWSQGLAYSQPPLNIKMTDASLSVGMVINFLK